MSINVPYSSPDRQFQALNPATDQPFSAAELNAIADAVLSGTITDGIASAFFYSMVRSYQLAADQAAGRTVNYDPSVKDEAGTCRRRRAFQVNCSNIYGAGWEMAINQEDVAEFADGSVMRSYTTSD